MTVLSAALRAALGAALAIFLAAPMLVKPVLAQAQKSRSDSLPPKSGTVQGPSSYRVIGEDRTNPDRRLVTVSLPRRLGTAELLRIVDAVVKKPLGAKETALVTFLLDGQKKTDTGWAVARLNGDVKVQFLGLSPDEITQLRAETANDKRTIVGAWITEPPLSPGKITIFRESGRPFLEWRLRGGSRTLVELLEEPGVAETVYRDKSGGAERFAVLSGGQLEVRDQAERIAVSPALASFGPTSVPRSTSVTVTPDSSRQASAQRSTRVVTVGSAAPAAADLPQAASVADAGAVLVPEEADPKPDLPRPALTRRGRGGSSVEPEWQVRYSFR